MEAIDAQREQVQGNPYRNIHPDGVEEWFYRDDAKNITTHLHRDGSSDH